MGLTLLLKAYGLNGRYDPPSLSGLTLLLVLLYDTPWEIAILESAGQTSFESPRMLMSRALDAIFALLAILYGYCTDSFPENTLTDFDYLYLVVPMRRQSTAAINVQPGSARFHSGEGSIKRRHALERFILTLSDQQLVTGLAVLMAGYIKICSLPLYYFNIVASLAWFSSTTHLATLGALQDFLISHPAVRNWRVMAMVLVLALLLLAQSPAWSHTDGSIPVFCVYKNADMVLDGTNLLTLITTIGLLFIVYVERIVRLYWLDVDWDFCDIVIEGLVKLLSGKNYREPSRVTAARDGAFAGEDKASITSSIRTERERIRHARFKSAMEHSNGRLRAYIIATLFVADEMSYAFVRQVTILICNFVYAITSTIVLRKDLPIEGIDGDQNEMGFGQLVPLVLLLVPALGLGEIYFGNHEDPGRFKHTDAHRCDSSTRPSETRLSEATPSQTSVSVGTSSTKHLAHDRPTSNENQFPTQDIVDEGCTGKPIQLEELLRFVIPGDRKDTGWALQQSHGYQINQSYSLEPSHRYIQDMSEEPKDTVSDNESNKSSSNTNTAASSSTSVTTADAASEVSSSTTVQQDPKRIPLKRVHTDIKYRRIFFGVFSFLFAFQLSFALALGGAFGEKGYQAAAVFLLVILAAAAIGIADGTRQRLLQIKEANLGADTK
ncbi:MAG: hypothetical protein Q9169_003001 [Polycauliona sp. 2 TL-2023]